MIMLPGRAHNRDFFLNKGGFIMNQFLHKDCREIAVESPETVFPQIPSEFPFTCLSCLGEIEDKSDLILVQMTGQ